MKKIFILVLIVTMATFVAGISFAGDGPEITVSGNIELDYSTVTHDDGVDGTADVTYAGFGTSDADVNVKAVFDDSTEAYIKMDIDDFKSGSVKSDSLLEEVHVTFKKVGGAPVNIKVGKMEVPFGMDKDKGISDPYTHNSGTGFMVNKVSHFGEVDNKFGVNFIITPIESTDSAKKSTPVIELSVFENDTAQDYDTGEDPADTGLYQSFAVSVTSNERVPNLMAKVSFISMHKEGTETDTSTGVVDDSTAISIAADYKIKPIDTSVYAELILGADLDHVEGSDQEIYHIGVEAKVVEKVYAVVQYNSLTNKMDATDVEPNYNKISIAGKYKMDNKIELLLEYATETYDADTGADDVTANAVSARVKCNF